MKNLTVLLIVAISLAACKKDEPATAKPEVFHAELKAQRAEALKSIREISAKYVAENAYKSCEEKRANWKVLFPKYRDAVDFYMNTAYDVGSDKVHAGVILYDNTSLLDNKDIVECVGFQRIQARKEMYNHQLQSMKK